jgi:mRNA interferase MazF
MKAGDGVSYIPNRGDVVWLQFTPQAGHEQAGRRPALVLSPASYNGRVGLAIFCPITSQVKGYPFEVRVPPGLTIVGAILTDQIKSLDWRVRRAEYSCTLPDDVVETVLQRLGTLLDPEQF